MGLSLSLLTSAWAEILYHTFLISPYQLNLGSQPDGLEEPGSETILKKTEDSCDDLITKISINLKNGEPLKTPSFKNLVQDFKTPEPDNSNLKSGQLSSPGSTISFSPQPISELDAAATKLQKIYRSFRTRRKLADSTVVADKLGWKWKALEFAALDRSSVSFFDVEKPETAISRWARARTRAAKVGKGLSKNEEAQKLALQHWLEAIDPRHRYGHNLHFYYNLWLKSNSTQPFFYWLDIGDGKENDLEECPRSKLQRQCIKYLGPNERESYEVIVENGKLVYKQSGLLLETTEGSKWIFVLSTSKNLYAGQKKKGLFMHSSFLAGGATMAAGRLVAHGGVLEAIWPYSGHYRPTEENIRYFISFLEENHVDLTNVKMGVGMEMEMESYEVITENGKLVYRQSGLLLETTEGSNWFFVLSTSKKLYVGKNQKGLFEHSGFLGGGATTAAGRLVVHDGVLKAIWPYSGQDDLPTEEKYIEFMSFLLENHVDLTNVKILMTFRALLICTSKLL